MQPGIHQAYTALPANAARAYRRLGALPANIITRDTIAAACAVDHQESERLLATLTAVHLLIPAETPTAHHLRDGIRQHARTVTEPPAAHRDALRGWAEWLLHATTAAEQLLTPRRLTLHHDDTPPTAPVRRAFPPDATAALRWLDLHRSDLLAAPAATTTHHWHRLTWQLADAITPLLLRHRLHTTLRDTHQTYTLPSARIDGNQPAIRRALTTLGAVHRRLGDYAPALQYATEAVIRSRHHNDQRDLAQALHETGAIHLQANRPTRAANPLHQALALRQETYDRHGVALTRILLAEHATRTAHHDRASTLLQHARDALLDLGDRHQAGKALAHLARVHARTGHHTRAAGQLHDARAEFAATGSWYWHARVTEWLALTAQESGQNDQALEYYRQALPLFERVSPPDAARVRHRIDQWHLAP